MDIKMNIRTTTSEELRNDKEEALAIIESLKGKKKSDYNDLCRLIYENTVAKCDEKLALQCDEIVECGGEFCKLGDTIKINVLGYTIEIKVTKQQPDI